MNEIINKVLRRRSEPRPTWYPEELRSAHAAHDALGALNASCPPDALIRALHPCLPFAAAVVETIQTSHPENPASLIYQIPDAFLRMRVQLIDADPAISFSMQVPAGVATRDIDAISEDARRSSPFIQALYPHFGLANTSTFKVSCKPRGREQEHVSVWLFHEVGTRLPTWRECRMLETLHAPFLAALDRMRLPLLPHEPLYFQIMQEQRIGYILLRLDGTVLEANARAVLLANEHARASVGLHRRSCLSDFIQRVLCTPPLPGNSVRSIHRADGRGALDVHLHLLAKEHHAIAEDIHLIELREMPVEGASSLAHASLQDLPARQREVAALLADTGLSYKQIADALRLSEGTVRKHTERVYRALRIHSRLELIASLKRRPMPPASS